MRILIACDDSEPANRALESLPGAGLPADTEALVLTVLERSKAPDDAEAQNNAPSGPGSSTSHPVPTRAASQLRSMFPRWTVATDVAYGNAAGQILDVAARYKPELIVVGSHGRGPIKRMFLGSVSQTVLERAACSVRVGRSGQVKPATPKLLVALDDSPYGAAVVDEVAARSWPPGTSVELLTVVSVVGIVDSSEYLELSYEQAAELQRPAVERLKRAGLVVEPMVYEDDPATRILHEARRIEATTILLGACGTGKSTAERKWLGSVSKTVAARAECSVEVVKRS